MKRVNTLLLLFLFSFPIYSLPPKDGDSDKKGEERIKRNEGSWNWGTNGHGSYDNAIHVLNAEQDVDGYKKGKTKYRVFTRGTLNYVEMSCSWTGGYYTYTTTNSDGDAELANANSKPNSVDSKTEIIKTTRNEGNWNWGTYNFGSFDATVEILHAEGDVVSFKSVGKTKYRIFTHGTLNFVEVDYGWTGGVFLYTTNKQ